MAIVNWPRPAIGTLTTPTGTTWFVDGLNGSDANNGSTLLLAKKTIGAANTACAAGDTIRIAPTAVYNEQWQVTKANLIFQPTPGATVRPIIDGGLTLYHGVWTYLASGGPRIEGLEFRNFIYSGCNVNGGSRVRHCVIHDITWVIGAGQLDINIAGIIAKGSAGFIQNNVVFHVGLSGESRGIFLSQASDWTVENNLTLGCRKEGIREFSSGRNTVRNNISIACWTGQCCNAVMDERIYNNLSLDCIIGFNPKHAGFIYAGFYPPGLSEAADFNKYSKWRHNTAARCVIGFDLATNVPYNDYTDVQANLMVDCTDAGINDYPDRPNLGSHTGDFIAGSVTVTNVKTLSGLTGQGSGTNAGARSNAGLFSIHTTVASVSGVSPTATVTLSKPALVSGNGLAWETFNRGPNFVVDRNTYVTSGNPNWDPKYLYHDSHDPAKWSSVDTTRNARTISEFPGLSGAEGLPFETHGQGVAYSTVGFNNYAAGDLDYSGSLSSGADLGDGYGTQVGAKGLTPSPVRWIRHQAVAASANHNSGNAIRVTDHNVFEPSYWNATVGFDTGNILTIDHGTPVTFNYVYFGNLGHGTNQGIDRFDLEWSSDNVNWNLIMHFQLPDTEQSTVHWPLNQLVTARYVRMNNLASKSSANSVGTVVSEFGVAALTLAGDTSSYIIDGQGPTTFEQFRPVDRVVRGEPVARPITAVGGVVTPPESDDEGYWGIRMGTAA